MLAFIRKFAGSFERVLIDFAVVILGGILRFPCFLHILSVLMHTCGSRKFIGAAPDGRIKLYLGRSMKGQTESGREVVCSPSCPQDKAGMSFADKRTI